MRKTLHTCRQELYQGSGWRERGESSILEVREGESVKITAQRGQPFSFRERARPHNYLRKKEPSSLLEGSVGRRGSQKVLPRKGSLESEKTQVRDRGGSNGASEDPTEERPK